jgi:hypothetical protein
MLVSELRELLKNYSPEELRLLVLEMYKAVPKKLREDKNIDRMLENIQGYMKIGKVEKRQETQLDIDDLKLEIDQFIDYAYNQYYFAPNNYVHKKDRPKWRFKVKGYIKDLQSAPLEGNDGEIAASLLKQLYEMLCYACGRYIFSTDDPFRSVGILQTDLLDSIISRKLVKSISHESVRYAIELVINSDVDRETLHSDLILVLVKNFKSADSKEMAIEQCKAFKEELAKPRPAATKQSRREDWSDYQRKGKMNNLVETVFRLYVALCEYEEAIKYFNNNYKELNKEITLYVLLKLLFGYGLMEYWLKEYERAVKEGVKPRDGLQKTVKYIRDNGKLPEYIYN